MDWTSDHTGDKNRRIIYPWSVDNNKVPDRAYADSILRSVEKKIDNQYINLSKILEDGS